MGIRRKSRELVVQALYAMEYKSGQENDDYEEYLKDIFLDKNITPEGKIYDFALNLIASVFKDLESIDELIKKHSTNWDMDSLATIDKGILRLAVAELTLTDTASPIIMNEAIEISKKFSSENSGKFINGVLNSIKDEIRK